MPVLLPLLFLWINVLPPLASAESQPADVSRLEAEKNLGLAALEQGDPGQARRRFEAVRRLAPAEPLGWSNGAVAAMRAPDLPRAEKHRDPPYQPHSHRCER